jgi:hypothetical protein
MDIPYVISNLYPTAILNIDYSITDYGQGPILQQWNTTKLGTQPTMTTITNSWNNGLGLTYTQQQQNNMLKLACRNTILAGFQSSALGTIYTYPNQNSEEHPDQVNMVTSTLAAVINTSTTGWSTNLWVQNSNGIWEYLSHNATQVKQASTDGKTYVQTQQNKLVSLTAQVNAATTIAAVQAIVW